MLKFAPARKRRKSVRRSLLPAVAATLFVLTAILTVYNLVWSNEARKAKAAVNQFYAYEQSGDFGSSWELFHSAMQARYPKEAYIQTRALIFMQQLGIRTFRYDIGDSEKVSSWRFAEGAEPVEDVYRMNVTQRMETVFGILEIRQDVYAAKEGGAWKLLWPFSGSEED